MKKIIALILALSCVFVIASCKKAPASTDGGETVQDPTVGIEEFKKLYSVSAPTKVVIDQKTVLGAVTAKGSSTLATGALSDGSTATVYVYNYEIIQSVENGAGDVIKPIMGDPIEGSREFVEGKGERYDGGEWDEEGVNFAPTAGSIAINLDASKLQNCTYSSNGDVKTLSFTVKAKDVRSVFGDEASDVSSEVSVVITANSAVVTGITISYTEALVAEDEDIEYPEASVTISTVYSYGIQEITLTK